MLVKKLKEAGRSLPSAHVTVKAKTKKQLPAKTKVTPQVAAWKRILRGKPSSMMKWCAKKMKVVTVRMRFREKAPAMVINVVKSTSSARVASSSKASTNVLHFLLERRWLGLGEKAQKKSLGCRRMTGPVMEGWAIR